MDPTFSQDRAYASFVNNMDLLDSNDSKAAPNVRSIPALVPLTACRPSYHELETSVSQFYVRDNAFFIPHFLVAD